MKTWFITGASRGFGRELTEQLLARGDRVAATARRPETLAPLVTGHGDRLWVATLDVTDTAGMKDVVNRAFDELGTIDVIASNAGYGVFGAAEEYTDDQVTAMIATNLTASVQLARAAVPHLRDQGHGHLLQVSSMGAHIGFPALSLYHATKWGIEGFYEAFASEVKTFGIHSTLVEPGMIGTSFYGTAERTPVHPAYADHLGAHRGTIRPETMPGDLSKVVAAMIDVTELADPPRRLLLGSDAYRLVHSALTERLAEYEHWKETAFGTDRDDHPSPREEAGDVTERLAGSR